jgi:hypothetical protein
VWQELRNRLHPKGLEVVTVALDIEVDAARPFIEAAHPEHPSLIDQGHLLDERFGIVNVPNGVWIDEEGMIVRPAEPAFPGRNPVLESLQQIDLTTLPPEAAEMLAEARKIQTDPEGYLAMLMDWVEHGAASRYALDPEAVVRRSQPRSLDEARAAAHFELGQHLHRSGEHAAAIPHWRAAHRLFPDNWTYKRQAWELEDPARQGRTDAYDSSWFEDVKQIGAENYYPPVVP